MISEVAYNEGDTLRWIDVVDPTDEEFARLERDFQLHPLALEDARKHGQRPKLEQYPTHAFLVAKSKELAEVDLFFGKDWLVTVRERSPEGHVWSLDTARARFERTKPDCANVGFLLYTIVDDLVDGYFDAMDAAEDRLEELEECIFAEGVEPEHEIQERLFDVRRDLLLFRRAVAPLREVVSALLRREVAWLDEAALVHFQDVYDHVLRAVDLVDGQRELMGNAVDAHLAIISNRMNMVMKRMTSWGAILLGATLVAAIYGMNFDHMPELGWQYGYAWAIGLMLAITGLGYWYFKRRDWI